MVGRIDRAFLSELADGDEQFMLELLGDFIVQAEQLKDSAIRAIELGDAEALHRATHALKGSSASVGANDLSAAAKTVDDLARQGLLEEAAQLVAQLWKELEAVCQEVQDWSSRAA
jgi:HPt (histidine-containing phosphotransfer) domain-containing protein